MLLIVVLKRMFTTDKVYGVFLSSFSNNSLVTSLLKEVTDLFMLKLCPQTHTNAI